MGEAKRNADLRADSLLLSKRLKRARFDLYSIGTRLPLANVMAEELSWWASQDEQLLGLVSRDTTDDDFLWMILARDKMGRFRCAQVVTDLRSQAYAETGLRLRLAEVLASGKVNEFGIQFDETAIPIDLLSPLISTDTEHLHPYFKLLIEAPGRAPARAVIQEIGPWLLPSDPHLVTEFQTKGFDQRIWEIYLWAAFRELNLQVEQLQAPDFLCTGVDVEFSVEATTVAPSTSGVLAEHPEPDGFEETKEFLDHYMAMKFASPLTKKLDKEDKDGRRYWERKETRGKPFLIAIADFHAPATKDKLGSMTYTQTALWQYLYGNRVYWEIVDGELVIHRQQLIEHKYKKKTIPSGFFDLKDAENVAAVVFSNAGTLAKFDRMGVVAGFGAEGYVYQRVGYRFDPDPQAVMGQPFSVDVGDPEYQERWSQEIQVFHNPNAVMPLPVEAMQGVTHHFFEDGLLQSFAPSDSILSSFTFLGEIKG